MSIGARRLPGPRKGTARRVIMRSRVRTCIEEGKKGYSESEERLVGLPNCQRHCFEQTMGVYTKVSLARRMCQFDTSGHRSR